MNGAALALEDLDTPDQFADSLVSGQPADKTKHGDLFRNPQLFSQADQIASADFGPRLDGDAFTDSFAEQNQLAGGRETFLDGGLADAPADADYPVGAAAGYLLAGNQQLPLPGTSSFIAQPAQGVDAVGHSGEPGGQTAEQPHLRGAHVGQRRADRPQKEPKATQASDVRQERDFPFHGHMPEPNPGERRLEGRGFRRLWRRDHGVETAAPHGGQNFRQELPNRERAVHAKDDYPVFHVCSAGRSFLFAEHHGKGFRRLVPGETAEQQDPETP
jgi:hypothetical protein